MYDRAIKEHKHLTKQISSIQKELTTLPDGKLICCHSGKHCSWFLGNGHTKVYLPKKHHDLARKLASKKYLSLKLEELQTEKRALEFYIRHHCTKPSPSETLLTKPSEYQKLLDSYILPKKEELKQWMEQNYPSNPAHPEHLIHVGYGAKRFRSKSEVLIASHLHTNHIPYRYECQLKLGNETIYPDFTIRHPITDQLFYWEHFGMVDNPEYAKGACWKLRLFMEHNIIPSIQLITTYETKEHPLTVDTIKSQIEHFFS